MFGGQPDDGLVRGPVHDPATVGQDPGEGIRALLGPGQARVAPGNDQAMVHPLIDDPFNGPLDVGEVEHHALFVKLAAQHHVHDPALAHQAPAGVEVGKVNHGEVVDKEVVHRESGG